MKEYRAAITKEEMAELPALAFRGEIVVVDSPKGLDAACDELLAHRLLGFDTESRPAFQKGVVNKIALLQLATEEKCFLFRLNRLRLDKAILKILETNTILKVGLSVAGDIRELETLRKFRAKGFEDIQKIAPDHGITDMSLQKIAAIVLEGRMSKAQRLSNWEAVQLTDAQKVYAATDAWVSLEIYKKLKRPR